MNYALHLSIYANLPIYWTIPLSRVKHSEVQFTVDII